MLNKVEALYRAKLHLEAALQLTQKVLGDTDSGQQWEEELTELIAEADTDIQDLLNTIKI